MREPSLLEAVRHRNRELLRENARLQLEVRELEEANANLRVERDAADVLLGAALDDSLGIPQP